MRLKKKLSLMAGISLIVLFLIPFILTKLSKPHEFMGIMIFLFFIANPIASAVLNAMIGKDIKKLWWTPAAFAALFLVCYWIVLKEIIVDLSFYAMIYVIIGAISMVLSYFLKTKRSS